MSLPSKALKGALRRLRLGDKAEAVAKPVAKVIDKYLGTDIEHCGGCAGRRKKWNGEDSR